MSEHLTAEEIKNFCQHQIKGRERVRILLHLENCGSCRSLTVAPDRDEVLQRLSSKEISPEFAKDDEDFDTVFGQIISS